MIGRSRSARMLRLDRSPPSSSSPSRSRRRIVSGLRPPYPKLNNGVYRAGFATTQVAYEEAFHDVFTMLDEIEGRLGDGRNFLLGDRFTEADVRLFVTLVRFDAAYHGLFKCNLRRIADYPALSAYQVRILAVPGVRETVSIDHIKRGYYSIQALNPTGIVPVGPAHVTELMASVR